MGWWDTKIGPEWQETEQSGNMWQEPVFKSEWLKSELKKDTHIPNQFM